MKPSFIPVLFLELLVHIALWRDHWLRVASIALDTVAVCVLLASIFNEGSITHENFNRISAGMSIKETERILGGPPGDYSTGSVVTLSSGHWPSSTLDRKWIGDSGEVVVKFTNDNTVASYPFSGKAQKMFLPSVCLSDSGPFQKVQLKLKRIHKQLFDLCP
jgi:hypothetical protein